MVVKKTSVKKQWTVSRKTGGTYVSSQPYYGEHIEGLKGDPNQRKIYDVADKRTAVKLAGEIGGTVDYFYKKQKTNAKKRKPAAKKTCKRCR